MTITTALSRAVQKLKQKQIKNPHLEAELLLSAILKKPRERILMHPNQNISLWKVMSYELQVTRRIKGTPLAYLTHSKGFYGRGFYVNKNVLIPRPETEILIDEFMNHESSSNKIIVDVGTGSGCIAITLAKELQSKSLQVTSYELHAVDISKKALEVAKKNAEAHKVNNLINFYHGNLLEPIINNQKIKDKKSEIIIFANLPYLNPSQMNHPSIQKEPKIALEAGFDGLKYYSELFKQIKNLKTRITCYLEIDDSQKNLIKDLIKKELANAEHKIKTDLRGKSRLVIIRTKRS